MSRPASAALLDVMEAPVVIVGMGQLGTVLAEGFLKLGHPVVPVLRGQRIDQILHGFGHGSVRGTSGGGVSEPPQVPRPALVLIAVGEDDLSTALGSVPSSLRDRVVLLQNELRPGQWHGAGIENPTVAVVWFEKKAGRPLTEVRPTVLAGPHARLVAKALTKVGVRTIVKNEAVGDKEVAHELVLKNLYILGLNLTGLVVGERAGQMLEEHSGEFRRVLDDIYELEAGLLDSDDSALSRQHLDRARLERELGEAISADPDHGVSGRSAPRRLERSLEHSRKVGLSLEHLEDLAQRVLGK